MKNISSVNEYIDSLEDDRKEIIQELRSVFQNSLPEGFEEVFSYNMITYAVPLSKYPNGYLNKKDVPLPFISLASQKHHIAIYHMGIYMNKPLLEWFEKEYVNQTGDKLDMGKSCIRFKKFTNIPFSLIKSLAMKMTVEDFIQLYERYKR